MCDVDVLTVLHHFPKYIIFKFFLGKSKKFFGGFAGGGGIIRDTCFFSRGGNYLEGELFGAGI